MNLGRQTSSGTPQSLVRAPFCGPWPPAGEPARWSNPPSDIGSSCRAPTRERPVPRRRSWPSARSAYAHFCTCHIAPEGQPIALPSAVPTARRSQISVISCRASHMLFASRKEILDLLPLQITQFITASRHTPTSTPRNRVAKYICRYRLV